VVHLELWEWLVSQEIQEHPAPQVRTALRASLERRELKATQEAPVLQDLPVIREMRDHKDWQDHRDQTVRQASPDHQELLDQQDRLVYQGSPALQDFLVQPVQPARSAQWGQ